MRCGGESGVVLKGESTCRLTGEVVCTFRGLVHAVQGTHVIGSRGRSLYESQDGGRTWRPWLTLPLPRPWTALAAPRLLRRMARAHVYHVLPLGERRHVIFGFRRIFSIDLEPPVVVAQTGLRGSRPLSVAVAGSSVYYGEYHSNPDRAPMRIWHSDDGGERWEAAWEFTDVRHVHAVCHDPFTDTLWVTTGDEDEEAGVWVTKDRFSSVERVAGGSQQLRVVELVFTKDFVYFGSDTPRESNFLCRMERDGSNFEQIRAVEGSVFYGRSSNGRLHFSTVCEPSLVNPPKAATLWSSTDGRAWTPTVRAPKDVWPLKLFQYDQIRFPRGEFESKTVWISFIGTQLDQQSLKLRIS